ncbi:MAG TPA: DUF459 domain-containing protein [Vineibacter sp.]|nr:DUF459 domain-containing protein [Vineibacter sp.]
MAGGVADPALAVPPAPPVQQPPVQIVVIGDSLAEGVWGGLFRRFYKTRALRIVNAATASTGFNRTPYEDKLRDLMGQHPIDLLVMMTGANDAQDVLGLDGRPNANFGTDAWRELYARRVQRFLDAVHDHRLHLIWIGLPIMRSPAFEARIARVRDIHQALCAEYFIPLLDLHAATRDDTGAYASHRRDDKGRLRPLRYEDGVHLAEFGNDLIGDMVLHHMLERRPPWMTREVEELMQPARRS